MAKRLPSAPLVKEIGPEDVRNKELAQFMTVARHFNVTIVVVHK